MRERKRDRRGWFVLARELCQEGQNDKEREGGKVGEEKDGDKSSDQASRTVLRR